MSRQSVAPQNQIPAARCCSSTLTRWQSTLTQCVGGVILYGDFSTQTAVNSIILDDRIDWRGRLLTISSFIEQPGGGIEARPGSPNAHLTYPRSRGTLSGYELSGDIFYTLKGWSGTFLDPRGGTNGYNYAQWRKISTGLLDTIALLYAEMSSGNLIIQLRDPGTAGTFMIVASEQTGRDITVP